MPISMVFCSRQKFTHFCHFPALWWFVQRADLYWWCWYCRINTSQTAIEYCRYSTGNHTNNYDFKPSWKSNITLNIFQQPVIFSGTLRSNIAMFEEASDDEIYRILKLVQLDQLADSKENLLNLQLNGGATHLRSNEQKLHKLFRVVVPLI